MNGIDVIMILLSIGVGIATVWAIIHNYIVRKREKKEQESLRNQAKVKGALWKQEYARKQAEKEKAGK